MIQKILFSFKVLQIIKKVFGVLHHIPFLRRNKKKKIKSVEKLQAKQNQKKIASFSWYFAWKQAKKEFYYFYKGIKIIRERFY